MKGKKVDAGDERLDCHGEFWFPVLVFDPERLVHLPPDTPAGCPDTQAGDLGW